MLTFFLCLLNCANAHQSTHKIPEFENQFSIMIDEFFDQVNIPKHPDWFKSTKKITRHQDNFYDAHNGKYNHKTSIQQKEFLNKDLQNKFITSELQIKYYPFNNVTMQLHQPVEDDKYLVLSAFDDRNDMFHIIEYITLSEQDILCRVYLFHNGELQVQDQSYIKPMNMKRHAHNTNENKKKHLIINHFLKNSDNRIESAKKFHKKRIESEKKCHKNPVKSQSTTDKLTESLGSSSLTHEQKIMLIDILSKMK